jgi:hypothetical protein
MSSREITASALAGLGHCVVGGVLAGLLSAGILVAVVRALN